MLQTIRTFCYLLLTLLLVALGLAPPAEAATCNVQLIAAADGSLQVTEQILLPSHTAEFTRRLPLFTAQGQKVIISQLGLSGGSYQKEQQGDTLLLHIRAEDAANPQLTLTYKYDAGADADDAADFLLFPLIDADLPAVQRGEFVLTLPRGFTLARCRIISGDANSRQNRHVEWEMTQDAFSGRLKLPLQPGETVWLQVDLPQGYWLGARRNNDISAALLPPALLLSALYAAVWRKRKPTAAPPAAALPPLCEYSIISSGTPAPLEFALQPLEWENLGHIAIYEDSCGGIVLQQLQPLPADATAAEKLLWARLFAMKQGDTAHLSFAAGEMQPLLAMCCRRTLEACSAAPLLRSPRRLAVLLPVLLQMAALMLNFRRIYLRLPATCLLIVAGTALLLLLLLGLSRLLRRGGWAAADANLILWPLLLFGLVGGVAQICGASLLNCLLICTAIICQTVLAAAIVTPISRSRSAAKAAIAAQQNILSRFLQEKPLAVAKDISCYKNLLPLALCLGLGDAWTELFAAAIPTGSSTSPRILLHRALCLQQALLPAFSEGVPLLPPHQKCRAV